MALTLTDLKVRVPQYRDQRLNRSMAPGGSYLTTAKRVECAIRMQAGDSDAGEELIATSLGQIHSAVARNSDKGVPDKDLVQEACLAVLEAGLKYDPASTVNLSTYVHNYISDQIEKAIEAEQETTGPLQFVPDVEALFPTPAGGLNYDPKDIITIGSLKLPRCLARFIIDEMLARLTDRQAQTLRLRFGLYNGETRTLEEVSSVLHCTRERVRQIEARALRRLVAKWRVMSNNPRPFRSSSVIVATYRHQIINVWEKHLTKQEFRLMKLRAGLNMYNECHSIDEVCSTEFIKRESLLEIENKALSFIGDPVLIAKINACLYPVHGPNLWTLLNNIRRWRFIFA